MIVNDGGSKFSLSTNRMQSKCFHILKITVMNSSRKIVWYKKEWITFRSSDIKILVDSTCGHNVDFHKD